VHQLVQVWNWLRILCVRCFNRSLPSSTLCHAGSLCACSSWIPSIVKQIKLISVSIKSSSSCAHSSLISIIIFYLQLRHIIVLFILPHFLISLGVWAFFWRLSGWVKPQRGLSLKMLWSNRISWTKSTFWIKVLLVI